MGLIKIKGHEFDVILIKDSFNRRAQKFKNNIINTLKFIGLTEDDVDLELESIAMRKTSASVSWYVDGFHLHYSYSGCNKYVENLYVVSKLIEFEINAIVEGGKTIDQFIIDFTEKHDIKERRIKARELLGVEHDSLDINLISKKYKHLAKDLHPDMPNGDTEKFKAVNLAHKTLKRELE
jgi:DnaJ-like protein